MDVDSPSAELADLNASERGDRESLLAQLAENVDTVFLLQQLEPRRYLYVNNAFERLTGHPRAFLDNDPGALADLIHPDDLAKGASLLDAMWSGQPIEAELRIIRTDGEVRWLRAVVTPIPRLPAPARRTATSLEDITERVLATLAAREAEATARAANEAKNVFLSRMSHELRTPLNAVLGFGQLLERHVEQADDVDSIRHILKAGRHLLDLINEVLDISRIESGEMSISLEPISAASIVRETARLVAPLADQAGIGLHLEPNSDDLHLLADRQRLRQVLMNLLSNAIKYNRPDGDIWVGWHFGAGTGSITVRDNGWGVAPHLQHRLFTPFDRLGVESTGVEGTGVGLAVTRALVQLMGGTIDFESQSGVGTTFTVTIPLAPEMSVDATPEPPVDAPNVTAATPTLTLLYVEDNDPNVRVIESLLRLRPGWSLVHAGQGGLGIELARAHQPDLILLDLHLPDGFGLGVLVQLKSDPATADIPVVVLSADASTHQEQRLLQAGAFEYQTKPLDVRAVLALLDGIATGAATSGARQ